MNTTTPISEMQKFLFGRKVFCSDGEDGTLVQVGFDAATQRVTSIGVKLGWLFGKTVFIPFDVVTDASGNGVSLRITRAELEAAGKEVAGALFTDSKTAVERDDQPEHGTLLLVAAHPQSGELAYIVAHHLRQGQDSLIQWESVSRIEQGRIGVSLSTEQFQALRPYRPDNELQQEVEKILFDLAPVRVDFEGMKAHVLDSVLYLDGNISSSLRNDMVVSQASYVQGLLEIKDNLVADDELAADLALALGRDDRTRDLPIGVYPRLGVVRLSGAVHSGQQKEAAEEIARQFAGVKGITNDIVVDPKKDILNVLASAEGRDAEDIVPGKYIRHTK